jgi:hypothetical protein
MRGLCCCGRHDASLRPSVAYGRSHAGNKQLHHGCAMVKAVALCLVEGRVCYRKQRYLIASSILLVTTQNEDNGVPTNELDAEPLHASCRYYVSSPITHLVATMARPRVTPRQNVPPGAI